MEEKSEVIVDMKQKKPGLTLPFVVSLLGVLLMASAIFFPYISATGDLDEYIEAFPGSIQIESEGLTASDLRDIPIFSVHTLVEGAYNETEGEGFNIIAIVFYVVWALTALFVILKKPIPAIVFEVLACGIFFFLRYVMIADNFVGEDRYAWGIGYYIMIIAALVTFVGVIWMLVTKISLKRQAKAA